MAAHDFTPARLGQKNATGDSLAMFLKLFGGELMKAYTEMSATDSRHFVKPITAGKSTQFPATGKAAASYHTPGVKLLGTNAIKINERIISVDPKLVADCSIDEWDEFVNHYETRGVFRDLLAEALAEKNDQNVLQVGVLAARAAATVSGGDGGTQIVDPNMKVSGIQLAAAIFGAKTVLNQKKVPKKDRYCFLLPEYAEILVLNLDLINKTFGGAGSVSEGEIQRLAGFEIVETNHMPSTNISAGSENNTYSGDFTDTVALCSHKMAVGTTKLLDITIEADYDISAQATLMVAKTIRGSNILRPECAVELCTVAN